MNVSAETLFELLCSVCEEYLSCSPVYITQNGAAICGHCYNPKTSEPATRNKQYEALARYALFPCKYRESGCHATQPFVESLQDKPHEVACEHRQYLCPVVEAGQCEWLGKRAELLKHCRKNHPKTVVENSCSLTHDITKFSLKNYLLTAFDLLFLLHTKVCVASGKIYHAVRLIGDPAKVAMFKYSLTVKREDFVLTRPGIIAPQGCLAIQEDVSIGLDINSLLHVLGGFSGASFILTIQKLLNEEETHEEEGDRVEREGEEEVGREQDASDNDEDENMFCAACNAKLSPCSENDNRLWECLRCKNILHSCGYRSNGCKFKDYHYKAEKHEAFFCLYQKYCYIAGCANITKTLQTHYPTTHSNIIYKAGSVFHISQGWWQKTILSTDFGYMICEYLFEQSKIRIDIISPLRSNHLKNYICIIQLSYIDQTSTFAAKESIDECWDWQLTLKKNQIPFWNSEFDIQVYMHKFN